MKQPNLKRKITTETLEAMDWLWQTGQYERYAETLRELANWRENFNKSTYVLAK